MSTDFSLAAGHKVESNKLTTSYSYTDKPTQVVSPIKCGKTTSLTPFPTYELFSTEVPDRNTAGQPSSPSSAAEESPPLMGSVLLRAAEPSLSEAFQKELHSKLEAFDSVDNGELRGEDSSHEHQGVVAQDSAKDLTPRSFSSAAPSTAPPPPPKNAARMLALALAESAQQVSIQCQSRHSEPSTPVSPPQPQETSNLQDTPHSLVTHYLTASSEGAGRGSALPLDITAPRVTTASSYAPTSSPTTTQQPLELDSITTKPSDSTKSLTAPPATQPGADSTPPDTPLDKCAPLPSSSSSTSPSRKTPSPSDCYKVTGVLPHPVPKVQPEETASPPVLSKPSEQPPPIAQKPRRKAVSIPPHQTQPQQQSQAQIQPHLPIQPHMQSQVQTQPHPPSKASARVAPTSVEPIEKPWEAIKPVQPRTESAKYNDVYAATPPAPPVRTIESKLATAALSQSEASYHCLGEGPVPGHLEEGLPHHPPSPRKSSTHQPTYLYHTKGEPVLIEPTSAAYYHQRPLPKGPQSKQRHMRPDSVPPHLSYVSKSEPQIPYNARLDNRYSTLGPRSYHHSEVQRKPPQCVHVPGPGHQGYSHDRPQGYPTIRRVHSLHVPSTIRTVPIHRTEVPPDDDIFFYHRPMYPCKAYQQPPQQPSHQQPPQQPPHQQPPISSPPISSPPPSAAPHQQPPHQQPPISSPHQQPPPPSAAPASAAPHQQPPHQQPPHQQPPHQQPLQQPPQQSSSQSDYHVTQLQPYFENGRVQYRYSPYSGSSPLEAPFYDIDPYGTIRGPALALQWGRDPGAAAGRPGGKATGYHFLARPCSPTWDGAQLCEQGHAPQSWEQGRLATYLAWGPGGVREAPYGTQSAGRAGARQKIRGPVLSQYDNVGLFAPADISGYETLHLRSKSDPGKAVLVAAESKDGRYLPRPLGV
ncbi:hypothetical protein KUCAC02_002866 [Chaenocephalus aceratus]|uniref:Uncharacterized protein n=1 Tax=Chaenocephalus aceratus TaxID=36190 RepID=A0ACB9WJJ9_CHAAC|nr:hypothetical protein KUCAC02_002866 [Chaenocephalus aceratus]